MTAAAPPAVDVALRDGSTVRVRPVVPGDEPALYDLLTGLSTDSRWLRFIGSGGSLVGAAHAAADMEAGSSFGLVALAGDPERIAGHAVYYREAAGRAEVALEVADELQGLGIGTILLAHLAEAAERDGIRTFTATVAPANHRMIRVFRDSGFAVEVRALGGALAVEMRTSPGAGTRACFEDRDRIAAVAAVTHVLPPGSVTAQAQAASHSSRRLAHSAGSTPPVSAAAASSACSACG